MMCELVNDVIMCVLESVIAHIITVETSIRCDTLIFSLVITIFNCKSFVISVICKLYISKNKSELSETCKYLSTYLSCQRHGSICQHT